MKKKCVNVLLIEDSLGDTRSIQEMINRFGDNVFDLKCADRLSKGLEYLNKTRIDVVLLDLGLPDSKGIKTFVSIHTKVPKVPIIVLSDLDNETIAVRLIQEEAQDYLVKGQIESKLLAHSIHYAIERQKLISKLQEANNKVKILQGVLPICAVCKKIRDDRGFWNQIEEYIRDHSEADFTHSFCPGCAKEYYPNLEKYER